MFSLKLMVFGSLVVYSQVRTYILAALYVLVCLVLLFTTVLLLLYELIGLIGMHWTLSRMTSLTKKVTNKWTR